MRSGTSSSSRQASPLQQNERKKGKADMEQNDGKSKKKTYVERNHTAVDDLFGLPESRDLVF